MQTLVDLLREAAERHAARPALSLYVNKHESWTWTYSDLWHVSRRAAAYLRAEGVAKSDRVVLWGASGPEWVAAFFGVQILGAVVVPLDARSREDLLERIEAQTSPQYMVIGKEQADGLRNRHAAHLLLEDLRERLADVTPVPADGPPCSPSDIAELVFTSGTTGNPKGVVLTHANILANIRQTGHAVTASPANRVLSILPLSHMFEQMCGLFVPMVGGASITYVASLRPNTIFEAMSSARSTNMSCVPQVLQLFRDGIEREVRKQGRTALFNRLHGIARRLPMALRRRLFGQIHKRMGGAFEFFVSGGAYLDPALAEWWEGLGIKVLQGYGTTEASPVIAAHRLNERDAKSVGRPLPGVALRLAEDHEILVRGDNITSGYWQNPEATAEAFADNWYRTGDLGYFDEKGHLHLRGRKKNMIVLASGLNVYPEDVEHALTRDPRVKDAVVFGVEQGQEIEVHAVLLLEKDAGEPGPIVRSANQRLASHQHVRGYTVWPDETFPMTPTLKVKRGEVAERLQTLRAGATTMRTSQ